MCTFCCVDHTCGFNSVAFISLYPRKQNIWPSIEHLPDWKGCLAEQALFVQQLYLAPLLKVDSEKYYSIFNSRISGFSSLHILFIPKQVHHTVFAKFYVRLLSLLLSLKKTWHNYWYGFKKKKWDRYVWQLTKGGTVRMWTKNLNAHVNSTKYRASKCWRLLVKFTCFNE